MSESLSEGTGTRPRQHCSSCKPPGRHLETESRQIQVQSVPPKETTVTVESQHDGLKVTTHGTNAEGQPIHNEFSAKYDGKDFPITWNAEADTIGIKKIDDFTNEASTKKGGAPLLTIRIVVSKDGKTRTATQNGKNAKGQDVNNTVVYDKQ